MHNPVKTGQNRPYKFTLYVERPGVLLGKRARKAIGDRFSVETDVPNVGHVFFGLTDEHGKEMRLGFHALSNVCGPENVKPKDRINGVGDAFKNVASVVRSAIADPWDDKIDFALTHEQYMKVKLFAEKLKRNPPAYNLLTNNCVNVAYKAAAKAGLAMPKQLPVYTPLVASLGIQAQQVARKLVKRFNNVAKRIGKFFSRKTKVSGSNENLGTKRLKDKIQGIPFSKRYIQKLAGNSGNG